MDIDVSFWRMTDKRGYAMWKSMRCVPLFMVAAATCLAGTETLFQTTLTGRWYPADKAELSAQLDGLYKAAEGKQTSDVLALILPHAGYTYSGKTAFAGLKSLGVFKEYKRIVIIGPTHHVRMPETYSVPRYGRFSTPLGTVQMDTEFIEKLLEHGLFRDRPEALTDEHSVQIQVPLLQHLYQTREKAGGATTGQSPDAGAFPKIVFIIAGQCSTETVKAAGKILGGLLDNDTLLIVSSDFTHYGPNYSYVPFTDKIPERLQELNAGAVGAIEKKDLAEFQKHVESTGDTICGAVPIATLLALLPENAKSAKIAAATSGDVTGDYANCVGYQAIAFSGKWAANAPVTTAKPKAGGGLDEADRAFLLALARKTLVYFLDQGSVPVPSELGLTVTQGARQERAAFVTLKKNGELRGCIGEIFPSQPLYRSVIVHAICAAVRDSRFPSVKKDELAQLTIEISALTPPKEIASFRDIRLGTDGVVLSKGMFSAVFLPQVATEQGWSLEQMLSALSQKAGLPEYGWRQAATFQTFQADVFGEEKHSAPREIKSGERMYPRTSTRADGTPVPTGEM